MSNIININHKNIQLFTSSPSYFYEAIKDIPILTPEEEYELFDHLNVKGDLEAAHKLVLHNLRYVHYVTRKHDGYGILYEDLVQEGIIGLMKSIKSFDHKIGVRLMAYATHYIEGAIREYVLANFNMVKIPSTKSCKKLFFNLRKTITDTHHISNDEAHSAALKLGVNERDVHEFAARLSFNSEISINDETYQIEDDSDCSMVDILTDGVTLEDALISAEHNTVLDAVREAMNKLSDREVDIINERYLTDTKKTLQQLSQTYGVSIERIRQIENNAIKKIKSSLNDCGVV